MLVLTRKRDEEILIGKDIVIKVLRIHKDQVQLGIKAPREIDIERPDMRKGKKEVENK